MGFAIFAVVTLVLFSAVVDNIVQSVPIPVSPDSSDPKMLPPVNSSDAEPKLLPIIPENHTQNMPSAWTNIYPELFFVPILSTFIAVIVIFYLRQSKKK